MNISTVLLDLDNTLLGNSMDDFLPAYFAALSQYFSQHIDAGMLQPRMVEAVQAVQANQNPMVNNLTAFMDRFRPHIALEPATLDHLFETFYEQEFPTLRAVTSFRPAARQIVETLLAAGIKIVIATNPLFPEMAIRQRLNWAGLSDCPFEMVTTMENSFGVKPQLRYYQYILDQTGSDASTTWMVGDDLELDIAPANQLKLKTWWITDHLPEPPRQCPPICTACGSLEAFLDWFNGQITM